MSITAELSLAAPNAAPLGRERVRLLETIGRTGSISAAARTLGISYKTAWGAICAMNNLVGHPLVTGQSGGRRGGGAVLTPEGVRLIETFHRLQEEIARLFRTLEPGLAGGENMATVLPLAGVPRTSARNALGGRVTAVREQAVDAEIQLEISPGAVLTVLVTRQSLRELDLFPGRSATALIKAPLVTLVRRNDPRGAGARNCLEGRVTRVDSGPFNAEITLDIGDGKTLCAIMDLDCVADLAPDTPACAVIEAGHIILAVE